ncbi:MAG: hypothetical protein RLY31_2708 [Bacteroidota bacterium]|jgi:hypothetical protein
MVKASGLWFDKPLISLPETGQHLPCGREVRDRVAALVRRIVPENVMAAPSVAKVTDTS